VGSSGRQRQKQWKAETGRTEGTTERKVGSIMGRWSHNGRDRIGGRWEGQGRWRETWSERNIEAGMEEGGAIITYQR